MKLTERDVRLLKDLALSRVLSRDQLLKLGYFESVNRCNRTMARLAGAGYMLVLETPFQRQRLYSASREAAEIVGARTARYLTNRKLTPRFLVHALAVTEVRAALLRRGASSWRFEAQLRHSFTYHGKTLEVRPDGMSLSEGKPTLLEVDLGHCSSGKFRAKVAAYRAYALSGAFERAYSAPEIAVLTVTTGSLRKRRLEKLAEGDERFGFLTFEELGAAKPEVWS